MNDPLYIFEDDDMVSVVDFGHKVVLEIEGKFGRATLNFPHRPALRRFLGLLNEMEI